MSHEVRRARQGREGRGKGRGEAWHGGAELRQGGESMRAQSKAGQGDSRPGMAGQGRAWHGMARPEKHDQVHRWRRKSSARDGAAGRGPRLHGAGWHDVARASAGRGDEGATRRARCDAARCVDRARASGGAARAALAYGFCTGSSSVRKMPRSDALEWLTPACC